MKFLYLSVFSVFLASSFPASSHNSETPEVNVYSTRQPQLIEPIFEAFTKETGIKVNSLFINEGLAQRLKSESNHSPADLVITTDIGQLLEIIDTDTITSVTNPDIIDAIPSHLQDPNHLWFAITTRARVVFASKDRVKDGELLSYEDLANPKWKGRICVRPGSHSYNISLIAGYLAHHSEEETKNWLLNVKNNLAKKPQGNDRAQIKSVAAGECDIAIANTYYLSDMLNDPEQKPAAEAVKPVFPVFENHGTHVNVTGMAMTKSAPHRDNALSLMRFMLSPAGQELYAQLNSEYPIIEGVEPNDLLQSWGKLTADTVSLAQIAQNRKTALKLVDETQFNEGN